MIQPQVVVFDLGKVLLDFDYSKVGRRLSARGRLSAEMTQKFIDHSPLLFRYETGLMTKENFYSEVSAETGFGGSFTEFADIFSDIFEPMNSMIALHAELRTRGIPTFIFSNTNDLAISHIRKTYPFFANFDGYILSYEHGAMKPDAKLYEVVERQTAKTAQQILYIDDRAENIAAGAARGWRVILQESPEKTIEAVRQTQLLE